MNARPKELKPDKIRAACSAAQGNLALVEASATLIAYRGNSDCGEGIAAKVYDGDGRGGSELTQPERYADAFEEDRVATLIVEFHDLTRTVARDALRYRKVAELLVLVRDTTHVSNPEAGDSRKEGAGDCTICGEFCVGIGEDRRRAGLCPLHYQRWVRAGRPIDKHEIADPPTVEVA